MDVICSEVTLIDDVSLNKFRIYFLGNHSLGPKINSHEYEISSCRFIKHTEHRCFKNHNRDFRGRPEFVEWSYEMSWRLARLSELKHSRMRKRLEIIKSIDQLMPNYGYIFRCKFDSIDCSPVCDGVYTRRI